MEIIPLSTNAFCDLFYYMLVHTNSISCWGFCKEKWSRTRREQILLIVCSSERTSCDGVDKAYYSTQEGAKQFTSYGNMLIDLNNLYSILISFTSN